MPRLVLSIKKCNISSQIGSWLRVSRGLDLLRQRFAYVSLSLSLLNLRGHRLIGFKICWIMAKLSRILLTSLVQVSMTPQMDYESCVRELLVAKSLYTRFLS